VEPAVMTYAPQAASVVADEAIPVTAGSFAYAGQSIALFASEIIRIVKASMTYAGQGINGLSDGATRRGVIRIWRRFF